MPTEHKEEVGKVNWASASLASNNPLRPTGIARGTDAKAAAGQKIVESREELVSVTAPAKAASPSPHASSLHHGTMHHQKAMAEQRRREALEESLTDFLPIENLRTVGKMTEEELNESKSLVRCFLSGAYNEKRDLQTHGTSAKEDRDTRYIHEFQHDLSNISTSYHYSYDPSLPLPESLLDRLPPPTTITTTTTASKTKNSSTEMHKHKTKRRKTTAQKKNCIPDSEVSLLSEIPDEHLLLVFPQDQDAEEEDAACETTPKLVTNVPSIVRVNVLENQECNDVMDASEQSSQNSSALAHSLAVEEASVITLNPSLYAFEWSQEKKGWRCKNCRSVHPSFQARDAFLPGRAEPNPGSMHSHKKACLGVKADLTRLVDLVRKLSSTSKVRFSHIQSREFQSVVRTVVNGKEEFVTLFTTDVRNKWMDPIKYNSPSATIDWRQYPADRVDCGEKLVAALVAFARKMGLGFDFVANKYFVELFRLISPKCCLPNPEDLIVFW